MKAIVLVQSGPFQSATELTSKLRYQERDKPKPGPDEVLVRVKACGVNRADLLQCAGQYPVPPGADPEILGLEYAGVIEELGSKISPAISERHIGESVYGLVASGAYAEYVCVHHLATSPAPQGLSFEECAALPEAFLTAYDAMISQGNLALGQTVLVHAAASGVGSAALQLAHLMGAKSFATTRSAQKKEALFELGATEVIVTSQGQFATEVLTLTGEKGVELILDLVGGDYLHEDVLCTKKRGCIMLVGLTGGAKATLPLGQILQKRIRIQGTVLRSRSVDERISLHSILTRLTSLFERPTENLKDEEGSPRSHPHLSSIQSQKNISRSVLRPIIEKVFPLDQAALALQELSHNSNIGKFILSLDDHVAQVLP